MSCSSSRVEMSSSPVSLSSDDMDRSVPNTLYKRRVLRTASIRRWPRITHESDLPLSM